MTPNPNDPKPPEDGHDDLTDHNGPTVPYSPGGGGPLHENPGDPRGETDPEAETSADIISDQPTVPHAPPEAGRGPEQIEGYELMGRIGRGGMGTVYMARRLDDRFRKRVAIKVMRRGMDTDEMLERFQLERQVLGALNHPNIARLYDAGATADGRPFFVMEYVDGQQITDFCDENGLSIPDRIRLFTKVCAAVHYAHQNLIVHRDLKPSNILVTADGEPKLLDFGIAKLLNPELLGLPALTRADQRIMTYEYASPEQVKGQQITTASDVYALGVILYELLTGHRPYQIERRLHAEAVRVICEEEPEKPSTAVTKAATRHTNNGEMQTITAAEIARRREVQISRLKKNLAGDLDNIILMALRKSAQKRYPTAIALADDLNRHLEGQTVTARSPTLVYRAGKFLRRHRVAVGVSAAMLAVLLAGAVAVSVAWRRAESAYRREAVAHEQARRAESAERDARVLAETRYAQLRRMFSIEDALYEQIDRLPSATAARDVLSGAMLDAIGQLAGTYPDDPVLRLDLARQYHRVGRLAAGGENAVGRGIEALARASELFEAIPGAFGERIENDIALSKAYRLAGDLDAAVRVATEAADRCAAGPPAGSGEPGFDLRVLHARALMQAGLVRMLQARYDDAEPLLTAAMGLASEAVEADPDDPDAVAALAYAHEQFGFLYDFTDREEDRLGAFQRCLELRRRVVELAPDDDDARRRLVMAHERVGRALMNLDRNDEAQAQYAEMQTLAREAAADDPFSGRAFSDLARAFENASDLARRERRPTDAETYARAFVAHAGQAVTRDPLNLQFLRMLGLARYKLGRALADQKRHAEAVDEFAASVETLTGAADQAPADTMLRKDIMRSSYRLGVSARRSGDEPAARRAFERAVAESRSVVEALNAGERRLVVFALNNLAAMAFDEGDGERMVQYAATAREILGSEPFLIARQHARGLALTGAYAEALDVLRDAMKPYLSASSLSTSKQREFDELKRLEAEYEARLEQQPGFDDPAP